MAQEQIERFKELRLFDKLRQKNGIKILAGVDEVGRGPLAGPVVAAACILPQNFPFSPIDDSKKLNANQRSAIYEQLTRHPKVHFAVSIISSEEIDEINIYQATLRAMSQSVRALPVEPHLILADGNAFCKTFTSVEKVVGGDAKSLSIAAASIIAKVTRDRLMLEYHAKWPEYGFDAHKGYGTPKHLEAIQRFGVTAIHRKSFAPCRQCSGLC